jgi:hypothetical protein
VSILVLLVSHTRAHPKKMNLAHPFRRNQLVSMKWKLLLW